MEKERVLQILRQHRQELFDRYHVHRLGVFGSLARGSSSPGSDIDIVVDMEPDLLLQAALKQHLESLFHGRVDVVRYWRRMNRQLKAHIDRDAIYV